MDGVSLKELPCEILYIRYYLLRCLIISLTTNQRGIDYVALTCIQNMKAFNNEMKHLYQLYLASKTSSNDQSNEISKDPLAVSQKNIEAL